MSIFPILVTTIIFMQDKNFWTERAKEGAVLSPVDRISEILFGLIMVLTFTGAISVATGDRTEIRDLLWAALACNLAWGLVDAIMYLMNLVIERAHAVMVLKKLKETADPAVRRDIAKEELPPFLTALLDEKEIDQLNIRITEESLPANPIVLTLRDLWVGCEIFLLVFLCTLPVALPFGIFQEVSMALRVSNGVALLLLFFGGYRLAAYAGLRKGVTAVIYTLIGLALVAFTIALGG